MERAGGPTPDADDSADNVLITTGESEALFVILLGLGLRDGQALIASKGPCRQEALFHLMGINRDNKEPRVRLTYREWDADAGIQRNLLSRATEYDLPDVLDLGSSLIDRSWDEFPPVDSTRSFVIGNLDGLAGMSSFRLAYLMAPKARIARCRPWKQALSICSAAPSQRAAIHVFSKLRGAG
jgi:hypothetical protein